MSDTTNIKNWDDVQLTEDVNNDDDISTVKFVEQRWCAKEKKVAEERRQLKAKAEAKRKVKEEVRHKVAEQEQLRVAQEAYMYQEDGGGGRKVQRG